ncbi:14403_t:CDS:2 [Funneliformis geosporum]|uniref:14403_t:CDS:1 n=1 Tax=Funneliformis geosporum TaxID=1117311 RepID=A0A9W4SRT6_9GLOM|nr:14403_t:CDS:2 [Funneliformis geosporum]
MKFDMKVKGSETDIPSNIHYLPSEEEARTKINQIKSAKNLDEAQATIEFLTSYFSLKPFKVVPEVNEFNREVEGLDFQTYFKTVLEPLIKQCKFKPTFATQNNYQELGRKITQEINSELSNICSGFSSLSSVSKLNQLINNFLSKYLQGSIYSEFIHDELGQQLGISNHQKFDGQKTGNKSFNSLLVGLIISIVVGVLIGGYTKGDNVAVKNLVGLGIILVGFIIG